MSQISGARVLGIDASLRATGIGVVEVRGNSFSAVEQATLRSTARVRLSECLARIHRGIVDVVERTAPTTAAIESAFFCKNVKTAMILGEARGVAIEACSGLGLPVYEYAPRRVKQAVVGYGSAGKEQVRKMVMSILALEEEPQEDAGDALAVAICHLHNKTGHAALMPEEI